MPRVGWIDRGGSADEVHPSIRRQLRHDTIDRVEHWKDNSRPVTWRKTADEVLDNLAAHLERINDSRH